MDYRDAPLITIGIVARNAAGTLERAVRSAARQSWPSLDILVIDDASTDGTPALLETLKTRYADLRVIRNDQPLGIAAGRNQVIDAAHGAFVAFFDAGDESLPQRLIRQFARLTDYEDDIARGTPVVCHTAFVQRKENAKDRTFPTFGTQSGAAPHGQSVAEYLLLQKPLKTGENGELYIGTQMARKSVYKKLGGFDAPCAACEGLDFNVRLALEGGHFVGIPEAVVVRSERRSIDEERKWTHAIFEKHKNLAEAADLYEFCRRWIDIEFDMQEGDYLALAPRLTALCARHPKETLERLKPYLRRFADTIKLPKKSP